MKHATSVWIAALLAGIAGCADDGGPAGPAEEGAAEKELAFSLSVPATVPTKQPVQLAVRVTRAARLNYPLTVTFEEANEDQAFALVATVLLQKPRETIATVSEDAARDPLYRVRICEAGQAPKLCVERTAQVDVLDFP